MEGFEVCKTTQNICNWIQNADFGPIGPGSFLKLLKIYRYVTD